MTKGAWRYTLLFNAQLQFGSKFKELKVRVRRSKILAEWLRTQVRVTCELAERYLTFRKHVDLQKTYGEK